MTQSEATTRVLARPDLVRWLCLAATGVILGVAAAFLIGNTALMRQHGGEDFAIYLRHAKDWLGGGAFYDERQLLGQPYRLVPGDSLYPPPFVLLMLPFLVAPGLLWWVLPAVIIGAVIWHYRPAPWTWPIMALCIASPRSLGLLVYGNPSMWLAAAVALSTMVGWASVLVFLKPSLAVFSMIGVRTRAWWKSTLVFALVSLAMLPDWRDYLTATSHVQGLNLTYSLMDIPLVGIALVAWAGRRHAIPGRPAPSVTDGE